jgi:hypothetical protein
MNVQHAPRASTGSRERHSYARVPGRWLLLARVGWVALVVLTLAIFFASLPVYIALLQTPCTGTACGYQQLTPEQAGALTGIGLFPAVYTAYTVTLTLALLMGCVVVSTVIIWRRSRDRMALIVALFLVTLGPFAVTFNVWASPSPWQVPNECLSFLFQALFLLVFSLFPTGQFVPHWIRWILIVFLTLQVPFTFLPALAPLQNSAVPLGFLGFLVGIGGLAILVVVQVYRYRRVSGPLERQQTKWVVFGFAVPITFMVSGIVPYLMFPVLAVPGALYLPAYAAIQDLLLLLIPLSFGFAMLRYRLWDVDVLINRTLVYGTLTVIVTLVYVGLIIGLQALLRGIISQDNGVAIVLSTLVSFWLFQPLRQGIQSSIDRRFYRHKCDAAKTLQAFSALLHQEVDLEQLREQVLAVVQETMQPTSVSLWLYPSHQEKRAGVPVSLGTPSHPSLEGRQSRDALGEGTHTIEPVGL